MASLSSSSRPSTRAIKIPNPEHSNDYPSAAHRRRRSGRFINGPGSIDSSDAGPSSLSSEQDLSWPGSSSRSDHLRSVASPATHSHQSREPRLSINVKTSKSYSDSASSQSKQKAPARPSTPPPATALNPLVSNSPSPLGPLMQQSSSYKSINLNDHHGHHSYDPDEPPRLITYTKSGQGFTWNDELFLPSYLLNKYSGRGRRKTYDGDFGDEESCPVAEIFVADEEAARMMP